MSGRCSDPGSTGSAGSLQRLGNATSMSGSRRSNMSLGGFPQTTTGRLEFPSDVLPPVRSVSWAQYRISTRLQCQTLSDEGAKHTCTPRQGRASYTPCLVRLTPHSSSHLRINQPSREIRDRAARLRTGDRGVGLPSLRLSLVSWISVHGSVSQCSVLQRRVGACFGARNAVCHPGRLWRVSVNTARTIYRASSAFSDLCNMGRCQCPLHACTLVSSCRARGLFYLCTGR